jgi:hypothetical protein
MSYFFGSLYKIPGWQFSMALASGFDWDVLRFSSSKGTMTMQDLNRDAMVVVLLASLVPVY